MKRESLLVLVDFEQLTSSANKTLWSGTASPASNATKHEQTYKVAACWTYEAMGRSNQLQVL
jgi:hypothetical protein